MGEFTYSFWPKMKGKLGKKIEGRGEELLWRERDGKEREKVVDVCVFCFFFILPCELPTGNKKKKVGTERKKRKRERKRGKKRK